MTERFTETLRAASEPGWSRAVGHRFVKELFAGAVPDGVMARYLIQDHRFLDSFLILLGAALASADTFEARLRFGRFIGMVSGDENTYFLRAFIKQTKRAEQSKKKRVYLTPLPPLAGRIIRMMPRRDVLPSSTQKTRIQSTGGRLAALPD